MPWNKNYAVYWKTVRSLLNLTKPFPTIYFQSIDHNGIYLRSFCTFCSPGNRGPLNVTIVQVGGGNNNGGGGGGEYLGLDTPELKPIPSPLSETSATLPSDNNDTFTGGKNIQFYEEKRSASCFHFTSATIIDENSLHLSQLITDLCPEPNLSWNSVLNY